MEHLDMSCKSLGDRIIELRSQMHLSQIEFAKFLEIPQSTLSVYENNKATPSVNSMVLMADKCNVSLDWLTGRTSKLCQKNKSKEFYLTSDQNFTCVGKPHTGD